ncbi:hypothetical protein QTG54_002331 [Skeletonema marinoi]|uniref:Uncharacterized protein n=1 Tax=Skeletonema marinoi TaxID=267567 RepID=A0AAD8YJ27_9STRA|nr:hypothetical protein QTG54_002331 [Skeletonema marinoi]
MKLSAAIALAAVGGSSAYSVNRSTLRSLGQKNVAARSNVRNIRSNDIKMEDFGFLKGSGIGFEDAWSGADASDACISEVGLERALNADGLRYKMNKTKDEASQCEPLFGLPGFTVNLPSSERHTLDLPVSTPSGKPLVSPPPPTTKPDRMRN